MTGEAETGNAGEQPFKDQPAGKLIKPMSQAASPDKSGLATPYPSVDRFSQCLKNAYLKLNQPNRGTQPTRCVKTLKPRIKKISTIELDDLGYSKFVESKQKSLGLTEYLAARVVAEYKEAYRVRSVNGEYVAEITGKQMFNAVKREDYPAVGDWVTITELDKERAVIQNILPRKTILKKKYSDKQDVQIIATNIDTAFVSVTLFL